MSSSSNYVPPTPTAVASEATSAEQSDGLMLDQNINEESSTTPPASSTKNKWLRILLALVLIGILVFVIIDSFTNRHVTTALRNFMEWVQIHPFQGALAVVLVYIVATVFFVPGSILTFGTGFAFGTAFDSVVLGVLVASTAVFIGAVLGSLAAFILGRYAFRGWVQRNLAAKYRMFRAVDRAMQGSSGLKIMILLRLSPLIPFAALDYLLGISSITMWNYLLALIAIIPATIVYTALGATASSITMDEDDDNDEHRTVKLVMLILGIVFAVAGVFVASYYSKKELDNIIAQDEAVEQQKETHNNKDGTEAVTAPVPPENAVV
mmetsp:Transcript_23452/g.38813  ORF Transcript_23452/g.38813 Transcript_23452/m.38813 type:complete len:323 (+) Transcript_23452:50-1018(+)